jgi:hypothetical protein
VEGDYRVQRMPDGVVGEESLGCEIQACDPKTGSPQSGKKQGESRRPPKPKGRAGKISGQVLV